MMIVKLGGSLITDKTKLRTFREDRMKVLAQEIGMAGADMILVHGAGSFGHILAKDYKLMEGYRNEKQIAGVSRVQRDVRLLNMMVVDALLEYGVRPVSLPPSSIVRMDDGELESMDTRPFHDYLALGMVPVTFGDVVPDTKRKFTICSGDDLVLWLSREFRPKRVAFVTDTEGVYPAYPPPEDGRIIEKLDWETFKGIQDGATESVDVTGGIIRKLGLMFDIADMGVDTWIISGRVEGRLVRFLMGHTVPGTQIVRR